MSKMDISKRRAIFSGLPKDIQENCKALVDFFGSGEDNDLADIIYDLPVNDIQAINTSQIKGKYFVEFVKVMQITSRYERRIQYWLLKALEKIQEGEGTKVGLRALLRRLCALKQLCSKDKAKRLVRKDRNLDCMVIVAMERVDIKKGFPACHALICDIEGASDEIRVKALAELKREVGRSRMRFSNTRCKYFRKAMCLNYVAIFDEFWATHNPPLHKTRLDRIVIDVYYPDYLTWKDEIKSMIAESDPDIRLKYDKSRMVSKSFIEAIEMAEKDAGLEENIDKLSERMKAEYQRQEAEGYLKFGKIIKKESWGTAEFVFKPHNPGGPIRLRMIVNVQSLIQQELFEINPSLKEVYKKASWTGDSETNFILPKDYDYYYQHEFLICDWLYRKAKELYQECLFETMKRGIQNPDKLIVTVSQFEICWEEPFLNKQFEKSFSKTPDPALFNYLYKKHIHNLTIGKHSNLKYEKETCREAFYCDIDSFDPTMPIMQYKIYPKFWLNGIPYIRHEMTNTQFSKLMDCADPENPGGLNNSLLFNPEGARWVFEMALYMEFFNYNGYGYNNRYKEHLNPAPPDEYLARVYARAYFPRSVESHIGEFIQLYRTHKLPKSIKGRPRMQMEEDGIILKEHRGSYLATARYLNSFNGSPP